MPNTRTSSQTSARHSGGSRTSGASAQKEIIALLKEDHKRAKKAFRDFEKLDSEEEIQARQNLVEQTCADLELHATLEEELFYPAAREALDEADLIDEAEVEHMSLKRLIADLKALHPDDEKYCATFKVLGEYVNHHVGEEESEIFPQMAKANIDWVELQQEMMQRRQQLSGGAAQGDAGESMEKEDDENSSNAGNTGRARKSSRGKGAGSSASAADKEE